MTLEMILLIISSLVILFLLILVVFMYIRIRQLVRDFELLESQIMVTDSEFDALMANVDEIGHLKI
ncbi:MAG: hypothetical protein A4E38_00368 [Methanoregulaceae archaeon PtaB.Bin108]|jgi:cell division protein FtsL|nr:MAG: hypothetical protein A4E38_00368 [Methanoregulaceae archaeon PtaB.Bin108]